MDDRPSGAPGRLRIRRATGTDAHAVAAMHVRAWQAAYRGILSDGFLDGLDVSARAARYSFDRDGDDVPLTWLAIDEGGAVVGMVSVGRGRDDALRSLGEVMALYVAPDRWRSGAGSALMARAEALLADAGFAEAFLWVLEANARARRFYEAAGWRTDGGSKTVDIGARKVVEVRYRRLLASGARDMPA